MKDKKIGAEKTGSQIDYQWLPTKQVPVFEDLQGHCDPMMGLAVDTNGDWLLLTRLSSRQEGNESTLWRSDDEGKTWIKPADSSEARERGL